MSLGVYVLIQEQKMLKISEKFGINQPRYRKEIQKWRSS
jgi:hypothetical protein